jgi:flagellar biosynthesis anti-sigma factor FlgM
MDINGINPLGRLDKSEQRTEQQEVRPVRPEAPKSDPAKDTVEVSSRDDVARLAAEAAKLPEVRTERVEELQTAIAKGEYQVQAEDIAAKMLGDLA